MDITMFLTQYMRQIPTLLVYVVACVVIVSQWRKAPRAAAWAMAGFGILLVLALVMPILHFVLMRIGMGNIMWGYTVLGFFTNILHAAALSFLLVAVFTGRGPNGTR